MTIKIKLKNNRCQICNKRYGLIPFECNCGGKFCTQHRYTDSHNCEFDHLSLESERLRQGQQPYLVD